MIEPQSDSPPALQKEDKKVTVSTANIKLLLSISKGGVLEPWPMIEPQSDSQPYLFLKEEGKCDTYDAFY